MRKTVLDGWEIRIESEWKNGPREELAIASRRILSPLQDIDQTNAEEEKRPAETAATEGTTTRQQLELKLQLLLLLMRRRRASRLHKCAKHERGSGCGVLLV